MSVPRRLLQLGIVVIGLAYAYTLYTRNRSPDAFSVEQAVLESWNRVIELPTAQFAKIVVG